MILILMINVKFQNVEAKIVHSGRRRSVQELEIRVLEWDFNKWFPSVHIHVAQDIDPILVPLRFIRLHCIIYYVSNNVSYEND